MLKEVAQRVYPAPFPAGGQRRVRYLAEAAGARVAFAFFRLLPVGVASAFGGWIFQVLGPLAPPHRTADRNIRAALPELTVAEHRKILRGMWNNIGRVVGEYAHLRRLAEDTTRIEIVDPQGRFARAVSGANPVLALSAHFGNWELFCLAASRAGGSQFDIYRAANNPFVDGLLKRARLEIVRGGLVPKGLAGMRETVSHLRRGQCIGMVVDQKTNEGIPVEFLGRKAMTTRAPAALAYRFACPVFVLLVERVTGTRFRIVVHEVELTRTGNRAADVERATRAINAVIEEAIRAKPAQWMWVHRRWPD